MTSTASITQAQRGIATPPFGTMALAGLAAGLLFLIALVALGLGVAFPMVLGLADSGRITLTDTDLATARQAASAAWLLGAVSALHVTAAAGVLAANRWMQRGAIVVVASGAVLAAIASVSVLVNGGRGAGDGAAILASAAGVYLVAVVGGLARRRVA